MSFCAGIAQAEVPRVVTDIAPIGAIAARIMQGVGTPKVLVPNGASPHDYAFRPSEARDLSEADVVVWVGPGLTRWLEGPLEALAPGAVRVKLMDGPVAVLPFRDKDGFAGAYEDHADADAHEDHAGADAHDHGPTDPHIWLDPANGVMIGQIIADRLAQMDPEHAETYRANWEEMNIEITALTTSLEATLSPVRDKPFLVLHDAFQYFEHRFGLTARGAVFPGDGAAPGAAHLSDLRKDLAGSPVTCAFAEPQMDQSLIVTATEGEKTRIVTLNPMGDADLPMVEQYPALLKVMAQEMAGCLDS
jgi:zinc transport system substrate-binding protein